MPADDWDRMRSIRVPDDEWEEAKARATEEGETMTAVIRRALVRYAKGRTPETASKQ